MTHVEGLTAVAEMFASDPKDAYWGRRLLEELRDDATIHEHRWLVARAFAAWASHDPGWFTSALSFIPATHCFGWPKDLLEEVESLLVLEDRSLGHLILGRLWWAAKLRRAYDLDFARRAVAHFQLVEQRHMGGKYQEELSEALVFTDPAELEARSDVFLASVPSYSTAAARQTLLEGAARAADWAAYDRHRQALRDLKAGGQTGAHDDCAVLNLDGLTALARGSGERIPGILAELVECGRNVEFLGTPETIRLPQLLVARGEHLAACRGYLRVIHSPNGPVLTMLSEIEARLAGPTPRRRRRATATPSTPTPTKAKRKAKTPQPKTKSSRKSDGRRR